MSLWSSSYRGRVGYVSDSGSGSDVDADATGTHDARLIREMDLSGRHETVEYRPNPWSIARINAASRPSLPKPSLAPTPAPTRLPPKPQPKPIVEAFKRQAKLRDVIPLGDDSISAPDAKRGAFSRQGCESATEPLRLPLHTHKPQPGPTIHAAEPLEQQKSAHTSTQFIQPGHAPPPFKPRRTFATHRAARSSPVRALAPVGDRPTFHHSSPGPRSHVPVSAHTMRRSSPPPVSAPAYTDRRPINDVPCVHPLPRSPGNTGQETAPSWLLDALDEAICVSPLAPEPRRNDTEPPHIRTPEPKRKRLASPEPTPRKPPRPSATRPRGPDATPPTTSASRGCATAYAFGEDDDADAEWSTLARTNRKVLSAKRLAKPSEVRQSGRFHLPLLGPRRTLAPEVKRRVITYLPPPMASKKLADHVDGPRASANHADEAIVIATTDPPARGPARHAQAEAEAHEEDEEEMEMRVMDSDVTLVNEDEEDVAQIDVDHVCVRYPATRACMKAQESRVRRVVGCVVELRT